MNPAAIAAPPSPYKGLAPFEDSALDALLFFGRERQIEVIVANLMASRLTVLYGVSGVGKTFKSWTTPPIGRVCRDPSGNSTSAKSPATPADQPR